MGGCASRPKESDINNNEDSVPKKSVSETVAVKENNTEDSEKQNQTESKTAETTCVEANETSQVEPAKETSPVVEPEVAAVEERSSASEAAPAPEKVEDVATTTEKVEPAVDAVVVAVPEKVEVAAEAVQEAEAEAEPMKEENKKEETEAVVTV